LNVPPDDATELRSRMRMRRRKPYDCTEFCAGDASCALAPIVSTADWLNFSMYSCAEARNES
jgi:hypothetical protein